MSSSRMTAGFTAVEVLITLFIAAILIGGGYQVYGLVSGNTLDARERTIANNYAYEALRQHTSGEASRCLPAAEQNINQPFPNLSSPVSMSVQTTCPYGANHAISQVTVRLNYGVSQKGVVHALYVRSDY